MSGVIPGMTGPAAGAAGGGRGPATAISGAVGTNIGDATTNGGLAAAFDGNTNQSQAAGASVASAQVGYCGKTYSPGKSISKAVVYGSNNAGYISGVDPSVTLALYGKQGSAPANGTDGTLLGSLTFTDTADESGTPRTVTSSDLDTVWDHAWVRMTHNNGVNREMTFVEIIFWGW